MPTPTVRKNQSADVSHRPRMIEKRAPPASGSAKPGKATGVDQDDLGDQGPVNDRSKQRVDIDPRVVRPEAQQEDAVVRDRDGEQDRRPARPAMHDVVETAGWREASS